MKGTTKSGFKYEIKENLTNDWEFIELITDLEDNPQLITKLAKYLFDDAGYKALKEHCRKDGVVDSMLVMSNITEILNSSNKIKN